MQREITRELVRRLLPERMAESNKGSYGSVLAAAGSMAYRGAAALCTEGALRGGAGLVYLASVEPVIQLVLSRTPECCACGCRTAANNDWASPNNYTSKNWNDISESDGKTFFDPCPEGWRLPTKAEYSNFSTTTFTWDATNSGRTYNGNWFPAAGHRYSDDGGMSSVGGYGYYWSASPYSEDGGYGLYFDSGYVNPASNGNRASGFSVRCVQE